MPGLVTSYKDHLVRPCDHDTILEIRTSGMKKMPGLEIFSGMDKQLIEGSIHLSKIGLTGDEHDLTFHGGPDKAILGYCSRHYPEWQESYPERVDRFVPGGFGENFVLANMNERNVCIGDIVSVGPDAVMQVSLPRMPCFKLNHRFSLKGFAPMTYKYSRTGWYYRVLEEGDVKVGDDIKLLERGWPDWTIERIQEYLHRDTENAEMNAALAAVESLGQESRGQFQKRVELASKAEADSKLIWTDFKVTKRTMETPLIVSLDFEAVDTDSEADKITPGSHVSVKLPNGLVRSYSIASSRSGNHFELGIALDGSSRGGSKCIHDSVHEGTIIPARITRRGFTKAKAASNHCFIVGGIGITAFLSFMESAQSVNYNFSLHYAVRSAEDIPFKERLDALGTHVTIYDKSKGQRMNILNIVETLPFNSHIYACGPPRMMQAAKDAASVCHLTEDEVNYEAFTADIGGDPFEAKIRNRDNKVLKVGEADSLLQVLRREFGEDIASSCEVGNCGTCKVKLCEGRVEHRGVALSTEEKNDSMLSCISRGVGRIEIEI